MAHLNKQVAKRANQILDAVAGDILKNAALYGVKPEIAQKFAFQCDLLADHIAKRAGVDLKKLAAQRKQGLSGDDVFNEGTLGFNPEEIGEEVGGPVEQEPDEPYMGDHFTQQWNRELREKQEAGEVSGGNGSPEMQTPKPGVQANLDVGSKLASLYMDINSAAGRCASAKDPGVKLLGKHLASAGLGVLQFQARVLEGSESKERVASVLSAAGHVIPHLAGEVSPAAAEKLARMTSILTKLAQSKAA
jgi:hypothetical protein